MKILLPLFVFLVGACANKPPKVAVEPEVQPVNEKWLEENAATHNHDVLNCYQKRLKTKPKLQGEIHLEFHVTPAGEMRNTAITKPLDTEFDLCVINEALKWKFPWNVRGQKGDLAVVDTFKVSMENNQPRSSYEEHQAGIDPEEVRRTVNANVKDVTGCFEDRLKSKPQLEGKLVLEWDIWENGYAHDVRVKQGLDERVDQCIVTRVKTWSFPAPPKGLSGHVVYPFVLKRTAEQ